MLEFLGLPESHRLVESDLETALTTHMQEFLLELGSGFAFVARQKRLTLDGDHFYADLVFYHTRLKCYVVIDPKVDKLTHGDLGQMQMYVHYFDREICAPDDNPTLGLILCTDKNDTVVEYVLDKGNPPVGLLLCTQKDHALVEYALAGMDNQLFVSKYQLELPSKADIQRFLEDKIREVGDG